MLQRASPVSLRKALNLAHGLAKAGIEFVPMPVMNDQHRDEMYAMLQDKLKLLEKDCEPDQ